MQKIGKEIKIGLAVIGVLVAAFGYILVRRLTRPEDVRAPAATATQMAASAAQADKPTVVSATDTGRPADPAIDGASSSKSLFGTPHQFPASDSADATSEPRGSFLPAANSAPATGSTTLPNDAAPIANNNGAAASADAGTTAGTAVPAAPEDRFSQFSHRKPADAAGGASGRPQDTTVANGSHSLFTAGTNSAPAAAATAPSAFSSGAASAEPFQHKSAAPTDTASSDSPLRGAASPLDRPPSAGFPTGNRSTDPFQQKSPSAGPSSARPDDPTANRPTARLAAASADATEPNPLRGSHSGNAAPDAGASANVGLSDVPRSSFGSNGSGLQASGAPPAAQRSPSQAAPPGSSAADSVPPPITSTAINVPSQYSDSPGGVQLPANGQPTMPPQVPSAAQPAAVPPAVPAAAEAGAGRSGQYIVQPNDNYWTVSEKVYGTGGYFKAVYEHNRRQHSQSDRLQVGDVLDVPEVAMLEQMYPALCPKSGRDAEIVPAAAVASGPPGTRLYSVADGDTLYEIARRELGRASRWGEIYQLNHDRLGNDFGYLKAGTQLVIPADGAAASIAREPSATLQR